MEKQEKEHIGQATSEQVKAWKNQYRRVCEVEVEEEDRVYHGYFHTPTISTLKAMEKVGQKDEIEAAEIMVKNCWIGGSEVMKTDGYLFLKMVEQLAELTGESHARLKNL